MRNDTLEAERMKPFLDYYEEMQAELRERGGTPFVGTARLRLLCLIGVLRNVVVVVLGTARNLLMSPAG